MLNCYFFYPLTFKVLIEHLTLSSNEVIAVLLFDNAAYDSNNVTIISNQRGGVNIISNSTAGILSSRFIENNNAALMLDIKMQINFNNNTFLRNKGISDSYGVALYIDAGSNTTINLQYCNFEYNIAMGTITI